MKKNAYFNSLFIFRLYLYTIQKKTKKNILLFLYRFDILISKKKNLKNYLKIFKKQLLSRTKYPERQSQYTWLQNTRGYRGSLTHHHGLINEISIYKSWITKSNVY
jgi:hypothetical protein